MSFDGYTFHHEAIFNVKANCNSELKIVEVLKAQK